MSTLKKANRSIQSKARKLFAYRRWSAEQYSFYGRAVIPKIQDYLEYQYSDVTFDEWMTRLREILASGELIVLDEVLDSLEEEAKTEEEARLDYLVDIGKLEQDFEPFRLPTKLRKLATHQNRIQKYLPAFSIVDYDKEDLAAWAVKHYRMKCWRSADTMMDRYMGIGTEAKRFRKHRLSLCRVT